MKKRNFFYLFISFLYCILPVSCGGSDKELHNALKQAGANRPLLEELLNSYRNEPDKYEALCFLLRHIAYHHAYQGPLLDSLKQRITAGRMQSGEKAAWSTFNYRTYTPTYDIQHITPEFLKEEIEQAFTMWRKRPWNKHYTFEQFCEYILAYRIENEPLEPWRAAYTAKYEPILDSLYQGDDPVEAARLLAIHLKSECRNMYSYDLELPHLGAIYLLENRMQPCRDICDFTWYVMRSVGIPVTIDEYRISPGYSSTHYWNAVIDTTGTAVPFLILEDEIARGYTDGRPKGKVYRICYATQPEWEKGIRRRPGVPALFRHPVARDVTTDYFTPNQITVPIEQPGNNRYAYLAIFNGQTYQPIAIGRAGKKEATFANLEENIIYYPVYCNGSNCHPAGYPFLLTPTGPTLFTPDTTSRRETNLYRKYSPVRVKRHLETAVGVQIEGSNTPSGNRQLLLHITDTPTTNYNLYTPETATPVRYIYYTAPPTKRIELAEIRFYTAATPQPVQPARIYGAQPLGELHQRITTLAIDNDWVSFYMSRVDGETLIFDLGASYSLTQLMVMPRNDDNFIHPGDLYELFYHAGTGGWVSLGMKAADGHVLTYTNVPENSLLWLRNRSRGKEEWPFYYKNGKQVFI